MLHTRFSTPEDIPAQRELWKLAFGDEDPYIDNFYSTWYQPQRVIVLEEDGAVRAMTAWFDTEFTAPGSQPVRAAYIYALATHPNCRGRGLAKQLLADAGDLLKGLGFPLLTTVPAEPTLHNFFSDNGFIECFINAEYEMNPEAAPFALPGVELKQVSVEEYDAARRELLADCARIDYPAQVLRYQEGCCALSRGGLYVGCGPFGGKACICVERTPDNLMIAKEFLGSHDARMFVRSELAKLAPNLRWTVRCPVEYAPPGAKVKKFGMLRWLDPAAAELWDTDSTGYLGLAFD